MSRRPPTSGAGPRARTAQTTNGRAASGGRAVEAQRHRLQLHLPRPVRTLHRDVFLLKVIPSQRLTSMKQNIEVMAKAVFTTKRSAIERQGGKLVGLYLVLLTLVDL